MDGIMREARKRTFNTISAMTGLLSVEAAFKCKPRMNTNLTEQKVGIYTSLQDWALTCNPSVPGVGLPRRARSPDVIGANHHEQFSMIYSYQGYEPIVILEYILRLHHAGLLIVCVSCHPYQQGSSMKRPRVLVLMISPPRVEAWKGTLGSVYHLSLNLYTLHISIHKHILSTNNDLDDAIFTYRSPSSTIQLAAKSLRPLHFLPRSSQSRCFARR